MKHELEKRLIPRSFRFIYRGSVCATRQENFRKAWECLPRCALSVITTDGGIGVDVGKKVDKKDDKNGFMAELVRFNFIIIFNCIFVRLFVLFVLLFLVVFILSLFEKNSFLFPFNFI